VKRRVVAPSADSAAGVLLACEREALAAGDIERLIQVRSWRAMLADAGGDPELRELFAVFATEGR
jgi:hypothetical protein